MNCDLDCMYSSIEEIIIYIEELYSGKRKGADYNEIDKMI